ncbi:hypothetical protein [Streptomyces yangpuensis]|uniref:hypothetical protein n=1 Tax=Streptomyces yangpuensis TaxID=1648182 RepID=UPI0036B88D13
MSAAENATEPEGRGVPEGPEGQKDQEAPVDEPAAAELALRVFRGDERWGWEFVRPPEPPPHPEARTPPSRTEPSDARVRSAQARAMSGRNTSGFGFLTLLAGAVTFAAAGAGAAVVVVVLVVALIAATSPAVGLRAARRRLQSDRERARSDHEASLRAWQLRLEAHRAEHLRHNETLDTWFPISLASDPSRIDVFGGTGKGWASLLATLCGPLLGSGRPVVVLDLTQQSVAGELAGLAGRCGVAVTRVPMPRALLGADLCEGSTSEELAETLAEALASLRPPGVDADLHAVDVDVVRTVTDRLEGPVTLARLAAGLRVLLRVDGEDPQPPGPLGPAETEAIGRAAGLVGRGERVRDEICYVRAQTELLARAEAAGAPDGDPAVPDAPGPRASAWWNPGGLTVVTTGDHVRRRKDLTDRFVFFRLLHTLRKDAVAAGPGTLVVAGADHLGRAALEAMARQARSAGVRPVFLLEHLREDAVRVAGGSDSATVFMRMGNGEEAEAAARFIGPEHGLRGHPAGTSTARTAAPGEDPGRVHGSTVGDFTVGDFIVGPAQLRALPVTGLVLVEPGADGRRRLVLGDCDPGINLLPRRSARPRPVLP